MKLEVFEHIDNALLWKHNQMDHILRAKNLVDTFFINTFGEKEWFVNFSSRIKEDNSLKEKIIRQNISLHIKKPEDMFSEMSDLLGARIECRFIDDEDKIYKELLNKFIYESNEKGFYYSQDNDNICLKLSELQPLTQNNGFPIYKIDGFIITDEGFKLNFELQIKSIVNLFWGEIDHKILYKNYNFVVSESFVREIMNTINGSLAVIDRQMQMVYNHLKNLESTDVSSSLDQINNTLGKIIHDVYIVKFRETSGVAVDFRRSNELIAAFLFNRVKFEAREKYAIEFVRLLDTAIQRKGNIPKFDETITFSRKISYKNVYSKKIGKSLEKSLRQSLMWNIILKIIFDLNTEVEKEEEFEMFVDFLSYQLINLVNTAYINVTNPYLIDMKESLTDELVSAFCVNLSPDKFSDRKLESIKNNLFNLLEASEIELKASNNNMAILSNFYEKKAKLMESVRI